MVVLTELEISDDESVGKGTERDILFPELSGITSEDEPDHDGPEEQGADPKLFNAVAISNPQKFPKFHQAGGQDVLRDVKMDYVNVKVSNSSKYYGQMKFGKFHGQGTFHYSDGGVYEGQWFRNKRMGFCTFTRKNGDVYTGGWMDSGAQGKGKCEYKNGSMYEGDWFADKRHGTGKFKSVEGFLYDGHWEQDSMQGMCVHIKDDMTYTGPVVKGLPEGVGRMVNTAGDNYEGMYVQSYMHGQGTMNWVEGIKYTGLWENNAMHGRGKMLFATGNSYDGNWQNGLMHGEGLQTEKIGDGQSVSYKVSFHLGKRIKRPKRKRTQNA